jgi:type II secretory pathway component PulK
MTTTVRRRRDGFVLMASLWIVTAVASVSFTFAVETRMMRVAVTSGAELARARANAEAGVATAISRLDALARGIRPTAEVLFDSHDPWHGAGVLSAEEIGPHGGGFEARVRDITATLDINLIGPLQWRAFFAALGVDDPTADRLTAAIGDWRDLDDDPRLNGAERSHYLAAGQLRLPSNRDFASVEDLRGVAGMTPELFRTARPYLGVASTGRVNVNTAPLPVLRAVPRLTDDVLQVILAQRASGRRFTSLPDLLTVLPPASRSHLFGEMATFAGILTFQTRAVEVRSIGWGPGRRARVIAVAEVVLAAPHAVVQWRYIE